MKHNLLAFLVAQGKVGLFSLCIMAGWKRWGIDKGEMHSSDKELVSFSNIPVVVTSGDVKIAVTMFVVSCIIVATVDLALSFSFTAACTSVLVSIQYIVASGQLLGHSLK